MNKRIKKMNTKTTWVFELYIAGSTPTSMDAYNRLKKISDACLSKNYKIKITNLLQYPALAKKNQIIAIPTIIRVSPKPMIKIIGDLSDMKAVLRSLDLELPKQAIKKGG